MAFKVFEIDDQNDIVIRAEVIQIPEFQAIWDRDKTKGKMIARRELLYVWFLAEPTAPGANFDLDLKVSEARLNSKLPSDWEHDILIEAAIIKYNNFKNDAELMLESAQLGASKLRKHISIIDPAALNEKGVPIYTPKATSDAVKALSSALKEIKVIEQMVKIEHQDSTTMRGGQEKGEFEDGFDDEREEVNEIGEED